MFVLLSPAKSLIEGPALSDHAAGQPALLEHTVELLQAVRPLSSADLQSLMSISEKLGDLNERRFEKMSLPFERESARQAVLMFDGDVYKGLDAVSMDPASLAWADAHVGILSGLYGLLRPLDLIQPYRLEMGTRLKTPRGASLYAFWGTLITEEIDRRLEAAGGRVVVDLASKEYASAVKPKQLDARWITPVFKDVKEGKARIISFFAKRARGAMTRWIIEHRVTDPEQLKACDAMGYEFQGELSNGDTWVFTRPQPPPVSR